jgi:hypothetical protein
MSRQGLEADPCSPREMAARIAKETAIWAEVIAKSGIRLQ